MNDDIEWQKYAQLKVEAFLNELPDREFISTEKNSINIAELLKMPKEDAYEYLRNHITKSALLKLQNRYRQHKNREKHGVSNRQLKKSTLKRLYIFKEKINADSLDEAIEFLLSPEYEDYKVEVETQKHMMAMDEYIHDETYYKNLIRWLPKYQLGRLQLIVESAFKEGWKKAKASKKRTGDPINEALEDNEIIKELSHWIWNEDQ